jgi:thiamine kinase-like enzyme
MQDMEERFILQRMNGDVFKKPMEVMENIQNVTTWLARKIKERGGDVRRETLNVISTNEGDICYLDSEGSYWRVYLFVENSTCLEKVESADDFYQSAVAFGDFQRCLADFPAENLHETIVNFHNTADRFDKFCKVLEKDPLGRAKDVQEEIQFVLSHKDQAHTLVNLQKAGKLPLRVTHNDTKLNNILFDKDTGRAICVLDLDTVMPGLSVNDFGDSIRFGASTAAEDEQDLSKVSMSLELFEAYTKGFIEGCAGALTDQEIELLPIGAILMTFECGMRFLTDYLDGDHYFKISRPGHNLDRCRTQFRLVKDMEEKFLQMMAIVKKYR